MKIITVNKKARFNYNITDTYGAGIVLVGSEVKSIRRGGISINESF
ncbi:MAG: SsrA-binding protein, partial [Clostridia bacterium]|nr:SsrA-binding protein [Clostridia bacterium]